LGRNPLNDNDLRPDASDREGLLTESADSVGSEAPSPARSVIIRVVFECPPFVPDSGVAMILVSANGLGRQYSGDPIFQDLKFEVRAGERIGLVGPNDAGKTTLMSLVSDSDRS
jgi:ATPase subunit of ABC transporter with duplicated ATPase domains